MRMTYDPAADAVYLYLTERGSGSHEIARTEEVAAGLLLDFDKQDRGRRGRDLSSNPCRTK
jgi:uncharacterized protein YuzE